MTEMEAGDLLESLPGVIYVLNEQGDVEYINAAIELALGYRPSEVIGKHFLDFVFDEDKERIRLRFENLLAGRVSAGEYRFLKKSGDVSWQRTASRPTFKANRVTGVHGMLTEITGLKFVEASLRESESRYRSIFESTTDALLVFSMDGVIVEANPTAYDMYGYDEGDLLGLHAQRIVSADYFHGFSNFKECVSRDTRFKVDSVNLRKDGTEFSIEMHGTGFLYHGEPHLLSVVRDVTARVEAERVLRESRWRMEHLHKTAGQLEACDDEEEVYAATMSAAENILKFSMCTMDIVEGDKLVVKATSSSVPAEASVGGTVDSGLAGKTFCSGETSVFGSLDEVPEAEPTNKSFKSGISAPIGDMGVFQVASKKANAFTDEDVRHLELLLGHTAESLRRIRLQNRLKEQAVRDPTTGVYNRHFLNELLAKEAARSRRYKRPIAFLMIDIDRFKEINDRFGHQVGDRVLRSTAEFLQEQVRDSDIVVRYGGDEFLIVLPETVDNVEMLEKRLKHGIAPASDVAETIDFPVTLSVGSAHWDPGKAGSLDDVLAEADRRMYRKKRSNEVNRQQNGEERG